MITTNPTTTNTPNKTLSYWFETYPDQSRKIIMKAAAKRYPLLRSIGMEVEEMVGEIFLRSRASKVSLPDLKALGRFLSICTRNHIYSLGRKAKLRQRVFADVVSVEGDQEFEAIDEREDFSEVLAGDDLRLVEKAATGSSRHAKVFQATIAVWQSGEKTSTANLARELGWTFHRTARARTDLQKHLARSFTAGLARCSDVQQKGSEVPAFLSRHMERQPESAVFDTR